MSDKAGDGFFGLAMAGQQGICVNADERDYALRAMTNDGAFRAIAVRTTDTVQGALVVQAASGSAARWLGELISGTILIREAMAPQYRVQGIVTGDEGDVRLVADSFPDGGTRGLVRLPAGEVDLSQRHVRRLQVMRTLATGEPQQGLVEVPEGGAISEALMTYMTDSEQVVSMLGVGCILQAGRVRAAGGYMVQLLPEATRKSLATMTQRLSACQRIDDLLLEVSADPVALMQTLLRGMPHTELERRRVAYECRCSAVGVLGALAAVAREEVEEMIADGQIIQVDCDFCGATYRISPDQLAGLLVET